MIAAERLAPEASASIRSVLPDVIIDSTTQAATEFATARGIKTAAVSSAVGGTGPWSHSGHDS